MPRRDESRSPATRLSSALRSLQGDIAQVTSGPGPALQSLHGHLQAALAEQSLTLRTLKNDLTTALRFYNLRKKHEANATATAELDRVFTNIISGKLETANRAMQSLEK